MPSRIVSRNFAEIDKSLAGDPTLFGETHLLSISFDPAYDTPAVLRSYGGAYTGNYTKETFKHCDFAAPPEKELEQVTQFFGVGVTPGENKTLNHSLSTAVIGKDGKIAAWYPTNDWKPEVVARTQPGLAEREQKVHRNLSERLPDVLVDDVRGRHHRGGHACGVPGIQFDREDAAGPRRIVAEPGSREPEPLRAESVAAHGSYPWVAHVGSGGGPCRVGPEFTDLVCEDPLATLEVEDFLAGV